KIKKLLLVIMFLLFSLPCFASILDWYTFETDNFVLFYPKKFETKAYEIAYYLEKNLPSAKKLTGNENNYKTRIVIQDSGVVPNGYADPINSKIVSYVYNPSTRISIGNYENWARHVSFHELIHINQINCVSGASYWVTFVFGNFLSPNLWSPDWIAEGITVYAESQFSPYEGRLNYGYLDALTAAKAKNNKMPTALQATYAYADFPSAQQYYYGGAFFRYLAETYGEEKAAEYFKEYGGYYYSFFLLNLFPCLTIDEAAQKVYGKSFPELFEDWAEYEKNKSVDWQLAGARVINAEDLSDVTQIVAHQGKLYYFREKTIIPYPRTARDEVGEFITTLIEYDPNTQKEKELVAFTTIAVGSLKIVDNKIYYAHSDLSSGYTNIIDDGYGGVTLIYEYDLDSGQNKELFTDEVRDFAVTESGKVLYIKPKKYGYGIELWLYANEEKNKIGEVDELIDEIQPYQDGFIVVCKRNIGSWNIKYLDLNTLTLTPLLDSPWHETKIKVKKDLLYYTANYEHKVSVYKYDLKTKEIWQLTDSSYANDGDVIEDQLYYVGVDLKGEKIFKTKITPNLVATPATEQVIEDQLKKYQGEVKIGNGLVNNFSYLFMPSTRLFPYTASGEDGIGLHSYNIDVFSDSPPLYSFSTKLFMPLTLTFMSQLINGEHRLATTLEYPVYRTKKNGLSSIDLLYYTDYLNAMPGLGIGFTYPRHSYGSYIYADTKNSGSDVGLNYHYLFDNSSINFKGNVFRDFSIAPKSRYTLYNQIQDAGGQQFSLDYTLKILELRNGFWNPNIFFGDAFLVFYTDQLQIADLDEDYDPSGSTFGYELVVESSLGFLLQNFVSKLGIAVKDGQPTTYIVILMSAQI
ncbi:MAG: hypothetical protein KKA19_00875, partial [Candidatus Margulisbacteria bacterium]|nr:hypothetical protein [Candidatus Margulisiibacteriota bacterium]